MAQTSNHIEPCNIGSSEAHNRRTPEYIKRIGKERLYIRTDLTPQNSSWESSLMEGKDLTAYYNDIARMVKEKTGRAMQTKERTVTNKKTGRTKVISGSSPLRESVVVCKTDTTIDQLRAYCDYCQRQWGITALQIHIHLDEGHYGRPGDPTSWRPNCHAHIVWDWMNHDTGKSYKLGREDMSLMQDLVAECLEMERGTRKEETGKVHLERTDFIIAKQKREAEHALSAKEMAEAERDKVVADIDTAKTRMEELNSEIIRKQKQADTENGNAILSGLANLAGRGKYAETAKENERLKAALTENGKEHIKKYNALVDKHNTQLSARKKAEKELADYKHGEADRICRAVAGKAEEMQEQINKVRAESEQKKELLGYVAAIFIRMDELFRKAVKAIIHFAQSGFGGKHGGNGHQDVFMNEEARAIKQTMVNIAGEDGNHKAVGDWLVQVAAMAEELNVSEVCRAQKEVDAVASGVYDWRMERNGNELSR